MTNQSKYDLLRRFQDYYKKGAKPESTSGILRPVNVPPRDRCVCSMCHSNT